MRRSAEYTGFEGETERWQKERGDICKDCDLDADEGVDRASFCQLAEAIAPLGSCGGSFGSW
eukprot:6151893-Lingulodinium_polyedra.AAC.1